MINMSALPPWLNHTAWSVVTILMAWLIGRFLARTVGARLTRWASKTSWQWDDLLVGALIRIIPFWVLLLGCYIALAIWPMTPEWFSLLSRALYVIACFSMTVVAARLTGKLVRLYAGRNEHTMPVTSLTEILVRIFIIGLGGLMILHGMGIPITPLLTAMGIGGLAVALALQDTLSNLFAGFYLTLARHIKVGDFIRLEAGHEGYVEDIGWRATQLRMPSNNIVLVPNNKLGQSIIVNFNLPNRDRAVVVELKADYAGDLDRVERATVEVARDVIQTVLGCVPTVEPVVRYHTMGDHSVGFTVIMHARDFADHGLIKHEFIKRLLVRYRQEGIEIPLPTQAVISKDFHAR